MDADKVFVWEGEVNSSEVDFQRIVDNVSYLIYMENVRHRHLKSLGVDPIEMSQRGFDLVIIRIEIDYKSSLVDGDQFIVTSKLNPIKKIRFVFEHQVICKNDQKIMAEAKVTGVCLNRNTGRLIVPEELKWLKPTS